MRKTCKDSMNTCLRIWEIDFLCTFPKNNETHSAMSQMSFKTTAKKREIFK